MIGKYLQSAFAQLGHLFNPRPDTPLWHIEMDSNQAYGTEGLLNLLNTGLSKYQLMCRSRGLTSSTYDDLWKVCYEAYAFQVLTF